MGLERQTSSARWTVALLLVLVTAPLLLCALGAVAVQPHSVADVAKGVGNFADNVGVPAVIVLPLLVILPIAALVYGIVGLARGRGPAIRLDGTVLTVGKSSVDLATAPQVWIDESPVRGGVVIPVLNARRPDGPIIRLPLGSPKGGLPAGDLAALAFAIEAGVRGSTEAALLAANTANQLREWSRGR